MVMSTPKKIISFWLIYSFFITVMAGANNADDPANAEKNPKTENKPASDQPPKNDSPGPTTVKNLSVKILPNKKSVRLDWEAPSEEGEVIIARSYSLIDSMDKLQVADSLGKYPSNKKDGITSFTDSNLRSGKYYYAIVMASDVRKGSVAFYSDQNYTAKPIVIKRPVENNDNVDLEPEGEEGKKKESSEHYIRSLLVAKEGQFLRLKWEPPANADSISPKYTIYKSSEPLSSLPAINKAEKFVEVNHPDTTFLDQDLHKSQTLYYGVSVTVNEKETLPLVKNKSFVRVFYVMDKDKPEGLQPTDAKQANKDDEDDDEDEKPKKKVEPVKKEESVVHANPNDLYEILKNTYWKKRYEEAVFRLKEYLEKEKDSFYRGKAFLYIALSYFRMGNYREALHYMLKDEARLYNEERTDFYIKRCLEMLGARK